MHHIYTTPAFIVHSSPYGEAGKFLLLFTRDFGMIGAVAQGIRLLNSKLKYNVQDYDFTDVSIVRGKEVWRLTGSYEIKHENINIIHLKILKLLKRLLHGEEKNDKLFSIIQSLYNSKFNKADYELVECLTVLRILNSLGYVRNTTDLNMFLENSSINDDLIKSIRPIKSLIIRVINQSLKESHL